MPLNKILYRLKYTLYPDIDGYLTSEKDEWDTEQGTYYRKGTQWYVVTKEEYCKLENYDEDETEDFIDYNCDYDYVAYRKSNSAIYMLINCLDDFEQLDNYPDD